VSGTKDASRQKTPEAIGPCNRAPASFIAGKPQDDVAWSHLAEVSSAWHRARHRDDILWRRQLHPNMPCDIIVSNLT
jgi:hypothetical protein